MSDPPAGGAWRIAGPAVPLNPAWNPDVDPAEYPPLALPNGKGRGKGKQPNPKGKGKGRVSPPREPRHQNFSHRSGGRAQARPAPMREAPIKLKRAKNEAAGLSESFVAALEKDNPSLLSKLVANTAADDTDQFTIEMSAAPTPEWTRQSNSGATAPKLGDFGTMIKLREMLIARSGAVASNLDDFSMDLIEEHPVDDNTRKRTVFRTGFLFEECSADAL